MQKSNLTTERGRPKAKQKLRNLFNVLNQKKSNINSEKGSKTEKNT